MNTEIYGIRRELMGLADEQPDDPGLQKLIGLVDRICVVLASKEAGAGVGETASSFPTSQDHVLSPPSPRYACDGSAECALSDAELRKCPHFGLHEKGPMCGEFSDTRCSNCPPPHGICKEVKA